MSNKVDGVLQKIKNIGQKVMKSKKFQFAFAVFAFVLIFAIFYGSLNKSKESETKVDTKTSESTPTNAINDYSMGVEKRLKNVISAIGGVGKVEVFVSLDASPQTVIAEEVEEKTVTSGSTTTTTVKKSPVLVKNGSSSTTIVLNEISPQIIGVVVVAEGAGNAKIKLKILNAIKALYEIDSNRIEIIDG